MKEVWLALHPADPMYMTDQDLNGMLVTENRSLDSVKHILKLDRTSGQIVAWRIIRWLYGQWRLARVVFSRAIR
jgi:hypothetical protein